AQNGPSLFSAADQDRAAPKPDRSGEDLEMLEAAARDGDRDAQFRIGTIFLNSGGMEGSATAAARWFDKAAKQGHVAAQFMLASMLERGAGVAKDEARAIALYRRAASAGHVQAMHNLGALLLKNDTAQSYREAASWFDRAAEAGLADSQYNLALLYEHGLGIEQDLSRAYQWYLRAAKSGVKEAAEQAGRLKRTLSAAEMAAAAERANSWQPVLEDSVKSADKGSGAKG
ncbi:MAG: tetratricopeptide repeat protein, partial [Rhodomicrobium sp.]